MLHSRKGPAAGRRPAGRQWPSVVQIFTVVVPTLVVVVVCYEAYAVMQQSLQRAAARPAVPVLPSHPAHPAHRRAAKPDPGERGPVEVGGQSSPRPSHRAPEGREALGLSERTQRCPSYSGPGFNKETTPYRDVRGGVIAKPVQPSPFKAAGGARSVLEPVPLSSVRLLAASREAEAQGTNLAYLLSLDVDRLVWSFRRQAGQPVVGQAYGGWEHPGNELRGHFVGHYLSAAALTVAHTGSPALRDRLGRLVAALAACQAPDGYLSAFPTELFDRYERHNPVWAPYYTMHKIMAGLVDAHRHAGSQLALQVVQRMGQYFAGRVQRLIDAQGEPWHVQSLDMEYGGMNDVFYHLYDLTNNTQYLEMGHLFERPCFLGPLAVGDDRLTGMHGNTHMPVVVGAMKRYELTGEAAMRRIAENFFFLVNNTRTYATGGSTHVEIWLKPRELGDTVQQELEPQWSSAQQESCTQYNIMKIARTLYRWTGAVAYADFVERAALNGILGTQRGTLPGVMLYNMPLGIHVSKAGKQHWRDNGWGTPTDSFWCCYGTLIEAFAKLGESAFFHRRARASGVPELFVAQFTPAVLDWEHGLLVNMTVAAPEPARIAQDPRAAGYTVRLAVRPTRAVPSVAAKINVRVPEWAAGPASASLNGQPVSQDAGEARPGSYMHFSWDWAAGDLIEVYIPARLRLERLNDDRADYSDVAAIMYGPHVLAGLTSDQRRIGGSNLDNLLQRAAYPDVEDFVKPVPEEARRQLHSLRIAIAGVGQGTLQAGGGFDSPVLVAVNAAGPSPWGSGLRGRGGTDMHAMQSFRVVPGLQSFPAGHPHLEEYVSLESFHSPGCFVSVDTWTMEPTMFDRVILSCDMNNWDRTAAATFRMSDLGHSLYGRQGGAGRQLQLESVALSGKFLAVDCSKRVSLNAEAQGGCVVVVASGAHDTMQHPRTFVLEEPSAEYSQMSFVADGVYGKFLLQPLNEMIDEHYTVYWDIKSTAT